MTKIWDDPHMLELNIEVSNGISSFSNQVYTDSRELKRLGKKLESFAGNLGKGILDGQLGVFGQASGGGAFQLRFYFQPSGKIYVLSRQQADFVYFPVTKVADESTLNLITEPALLDRFIGEFKALYAGDSEDAFLEALLLTT